MTTETGQASQRNRLTSEQIRQYEEQGYLQGIPVFTEAEVARFREKFDELVGRLPAGTNVNFVNWWHKRNRFIYDLCMDSRLLDCVEDLLGPNFFLWGSQFFAKEAREDRIVPWHQDAQYWPLSPCRAVTVFVAFTDCVPENGCMRVIPGTHRGQMLHHHVAADQRYVLSQEIDADEINPNDAVFLKLRAGEISLHDDALVHGSTGNTSDFRRVGFTMRFSPTEVKCDLRVWPNFRSYLARGVDVYRHNPAGEIPTGDDVPTGMME